MVDVGACWSSGVWEVGLPGRRCLRHQSLVTALDAALSVFCATPVGEDVEAWAWLVFL